MVVVVALVEAHAAALVEGEGRVGRRAKSFGRRGHGIGQRQPEVQELAALEKDRATQARYVEAEALYGEDGPSSPGPRRLRVGGVRQLLGPPFMCAILARGRPTDAGRFTEAPEKIGSKL